MEETREAENISVMPKIKLDGTMGEVDLFNDNLGHPTILVFYPEDDSPVCSNQLALYNQALPIFQRYNARIYAISTDDTKSHQKFSKNLKLKYPLLSDVDAKNRLSQILEVYEEKRSRSKRAIFVFDNDNNLAWKEIYPDSVNPGAEGILEALDKLVEN